ncbi:conserved hypothetical protein [Theileria orientalis strain Shintoku]|uniref:Uncharacterized protein n=1 Tax=Theileria orientalis strain Shintoku TaxID=869250 RepID=J7MF68_THEOR|nr:conserved hypothetical protein [Theileria orientalis strain Shintoku]BAM42474.1 conserved hypothetical protein [Theileria orientalis strain Shintoku]|eukprot:XP_009692775.1 conserved hypothetical protein [Theileria orientalis strain Shintoku]
MKAGLSVLSVLVVASVSAAPFVLDADLLRRGSEKLAVLHHVGYLEGEERAATRADSRRLRFVLLVPRLHHLSEFEEGFSSHHVGGTAKHHAFTKLTGGERLLELVGFSDCKTWHAALLRVWNAAAGVVANRFLARDTKDHLVGDLAGLASFVHDHVLGADFAELAKKGLAAHELVLRVRALFPL